MERVSPHFSAALLMRIFAITALLACPLAEAATRADLPQEVRAEYGISRGNIRLGTVTEVFRRDGDRYTITSETVASGALSWLVRDKLVVVSEGAITGAGLTPLHYSFTRERSPKKNVHATFSWNQRVMTSQHDGKTSQIALEPGTLDRLAILYQFMIAPPGSERVEAWMTNGRSVTRYAYERLGREAIQTPMGTYEALHIHRKDAEEGSNVDLWLALDRHFVPLRIRLTHKDGTRDEQTLLSLSVR
jgi:Protein of unknown function (DUF3108)